MNPKPLIDDPNGLYSLAREGNQLVLTVLCGGVAMYEAKLILTDDEAKDYDEYGVTFVEHLALDVAKEQSKYSDRLK